MYLCKLVIEIKYIFIYTYMTLLNSSKYSKQWISIKHFGKNHTGI